jgi:hypothetical protein
MKTNMKFFLFAATVFSAFGLYSCDENATIDIPGPPLKFTLNYEDINTAAPAQRGVSMWMKKVTKVVPGEDVVGFLEKDSTNKQYADAIVAATLKDGKLTVSGGNGNLTFNGVDSVKIVYQITGSENTYDLVVGAPDVTDPTIVKFSDIKITKDQALEMMEKEKTVSLWVKLNLAITPNCFTVGAVYDFSANSVLSVKAMSALGGGLGF